MSSVEKVDRDAADRLVAREVPDRLGAVLNTTWSSVLDADCNVNLTSVNCLVSRRLTEIPDRLWGCPNAAPSSVLYADCNVNLTSLKCLVSRMLIERSQTD